MEHMYEVSADALTERASHSVSVFWDYENCWRGDYMSASECFKLVTHAIDTLAGARLQKDIYLYASADMMPVTDREEYTNNGVQIQDVVSRRKQESVDKRIIADIALLVMRLGETGHSSAICLISGDADYGYVVSKIKDKRQVEGVLLLTQFDKVKLALTNTADRIVRMFHRCGCETDPEHFCYEVPTPSGHLKPMHMPAGPMRKYSPAMYRHCGFSSRSVGSSVKGATKVASRSSYGLRAEHSGDDSDRRSASLSQIGVSQRLPVALTSGGIPAGGGLPVALTPRLAAARKMKSSDEIMDSHLMSSSDRELRFVGTSIRSDSRKAAPKRTIGAVTVTDSAFDSGPAEHRLSGRRGILGSQMVVVKEESVSVSMSPPLVPKIIDFGSPIASGSKKRKGSDSVASGKQKKGRTHAAAKEKVAAIQSKKGERRVATTTGSSSKSGSLKKKKKQSVAVKLKKKKKNAVFKKKEKSSSTVAIMGGSKGGAVSDEKATSGTLSQPTFDDILPDMSLFFPAVGGGADKYTTTTTTTSSHFSSNFDDILPDLTAFFPLAEMSSEAKISEECTTASVQMMRDSELVAEHKDSDILESKHSEDSSSATTVEDINAATARHPAADSEEEAASHRLSGKVADKTRMTLASKGSTVVATKAQSRIAPVPVSELLDPAYNLQRAAPSGGGAAMRRVGVVPTKAKKKKKKKKSPGARTVDGGGIRRQQTDGVWKRKAVLNAVHTTFGSHKSFSRTELMSAVFATVGDCGSMRTMTHWCEDAIDTAVLCGDIEQQWPGRLSLPVILPLAHACFDKHPGFHNLAMVSRWIAMAAPMCAMAQPRYVFNVLRNCKKHFSAHKDDRELSKECEANADCGKHGRIRFKKRAPASGS